jgi:hypothetical protein
MSTTRPPGLVTRRISDALWAAMVADAQRTASVPSSSPSKAGSGGQPANDAVASAAGSHPGREIGSCALPLGSDASFNER